MGRLLPEAREELAFAFETAVFIVSCVKPCEGTAFAYWYWVQRCSPGHVASFTPSSLRDRGEWRPGTSGSGASEGLFLEL